MFYNTFATVLRVMVSENVRYSQYVVPRLIYNKIINNSFTGVYAHIAPHIIKGKIRII